MLLCIAIIESDIVTGTSLPPSLASRPTSMVSQPARQWALLTFGLILWPSPNPGNVARLTEARVICPQMAQMTQMETDLQGGVPVPYGLGGTCGPRRMGGCIRADSWRTLVRGRQRGQDRKSPGARMRNTRNEPDSGDL